MLKQQTLSVQRMWKRWGWFCYQQRSTPRMPLLPHCKKRAIHDQNGERYSQRGDRVGISQHSPLLLLIPQKYQRNGSERLAEAVE